MNTAVPGPLATRNVLDKAEFTSVMFGTDRTVWLTGFLNPRKTSAFNLTMDIAGCSLNLNCVAMLSMKLKDTNLTALTTSLSPVTVMFENNKQ